MTDKEQIESQKLMIEALQKALGAQHFADGRREALAVDPMMQLLALCVHFKAHGWRDMFECPRDTEVEFMEFGSTGIHKGVRLESGAVFLGPDGDFSMPILWRAIKSAATTSKPTALESTGDNS